MDQSEESLFEEALNRYKDGSPADELIEDFLKITSTTQIMLLHGHACLGCNCYAIRLRKPCALHDMQ